MVGWLVGWLVGWSSSPPRGLVAPQGLHVASWDRDREYLSLFTSSAVFCAGLTCSKQEGCMVKGASPYSSRAHCFDGRMQQTLGAPIHPLDQRFTHGRFRRSGPLLAWPSKAQTCRLLHRFLHSPVSDRSTNCSRGAVPNGLLPIAYDVVLRLRSARQGNHGFSRGRLMEAHEMIVPLTEVIMGVLEHNTK